MTSVFKQRRCKQVCIYIKPETDEWIKEYCKRERLRRSEFLGELIDKIIDKVISEDDEECLIK